MGMPAMALPLFTTADKGDDGRELATAYGPVELNPEHDFYIGADGETNNAAELSAVYHALNWLRMDPRAIEAKEISLISDSEYVLGLLQEGRAPALHKNLAENTRKLYEQLRDRVTLHHVISHAGVYWNERADKLATKARNGETKYPKYSPSIRIAPPPTYACGIGKDARGEIILKAVITPTVFDALNDIVTAANRAGDFTVLYNFLKQSLWNSKLLQVNLAVYINTLRNSRKTDPSGYCGYEVSLQAQAALSAPSYQHRPHIVDDLRISNANLQELAIKLRKSAARITDPTMKSKVDRVVGTWEAGSRTIGSDSGLWCPNTLIMHLTPGVPVFQAPTAEGLAWATTPGNMTLMEASNAWINGVFIGQTETHFFINLCNNDGTDNEDIVDRRTRKFREALKSLAKGVIAKWPMTRPKAIFN